MKEAFFIPPNTLTGHAFDPDTSYCTRCGQSAEHVLDNRLACFGGPNIQPISHLRAAVRLASLTGVARPDPAGVA